MDRRNRKACRQKRARTRFVGRLCIAIVLLDLEEEYLIRVVAILPSDLRGCSRCPIGNCNGNFLDNHRYMPHLGPHGESKAACSLPVDRLGF